ncbi:DUF924 family protein [Burkholderia sp. Ac-20384]|jgi:uncharacterized protein (DUF924 family)|uniref:DUF924 family protein n=1 Tax=Burkholderia TaxID=32008 RepID=UPI0014540056|nr:MULTISPECIES: DUF924 family protein [Burkholderia]MBN3824503.1 DUF924 family protein [Burkholderia sp. Ac-20384]VWC33672.1 membrane protein [Burkholderia lata]
MKIDTPLPAPPPAQAVIRFWIDAGPAQWFAKHPDFDRRFRERFLDAHLAAARRELDGWLSTPYGTLALLLLTDQFPRNAFRGTARMYATDALARQFATHAYEHDQMAHVERPLRLFFCLPFAHSEDLDDQRISVELNGRLGQPWLSHAIGHRDIVARFGRFPHRNPLLGRETTRDEARFLAEGGFAG